MAQRPQMPRFGRVLTEEDADGRMAWQSADLTIFAFTPAVSPCPPYLNVRRDGPRFNVTVRAPPAAGDHGCGDTATITIDRAELMGLFRAIAHELKPVFRLKLEDF